MLGVSKVIDLANEVRAAKEFWKSFPLNQYYRDHQVQTDLVIEEIRSILNVHEACSVFEFGCNMGRNLFYIRNAFPERRLRVYGIDINLSAIEEGRKAFGLSIGELGMGDEQALYTFPDGCFDVVFTVAFWIIFPTLFLCWNSYYAWPDLLWFASNSTLG